MHFTDDISLKLLCMQCQSLDVKLFQHGHNFSSKHRIKTNIILAEIIDYFRF